VNRYKIRVQLTGRRSSMRNHVRLAPILAITCTILATAISSVAQQNRSPEKARAGIERLHQLDIETTISGKTDGLAKLWDKDAVRLLEILLPKLAKQRSMLRTRRRKQLARA